MSQYWKADKATSAKIRELMKQEDEMIDRACELSASLGGSKSQVGTRRNFGRFYVCGFVFKDESKADPKKLRKHKAMGVFVPIRNKSNREFVAQFDALMCHAVADIKRLLGLNLISTDEHGFHSTGLGLKIRDDAVYVETDEVKKAPKGCTRISDLQYEKALAKKAKAKAS